VDQVAFEWLTNLVLEAVDRGAPVDAPALTFLLRRYRESDRSDLLNALEPALALAIEQQSTAESSGERVAWLRLFWEAATLSDDERVRGAGAELIDGLRRDWGRAGVVETAMAEVDAVLACRQLSERPTLVPEAIDELERVVGDAYSPGDGLTSRVHDSSGPRGRLADHVRTSSALLTAFDVTGRLPYSMLAEELMGWAKRSLWDEAAGALRESHLDPRHPFVLNCEAARVFCRLAILHGQEDYRSAAVLASDADYAADATRILTTQNRSYQHHGLTSAVYGLALTEWLSLR
jgi:hypothetical protein